MLFEWGSSNYQEWGGGGVEGKIGVKSIESSESRVLLRREGRE